MKVLLVSTGSGSQGGGEYYLLLLARVLRQHNIDVHLSFTSHPRMDEMRRRGQEFATVHSVAGINTYDRPFRQISALFDSRSITLYRNLFRQLSPDIIHINQQVLEDGLEIICAARQSGIPFVVTTHVTHGAKTLGARFGWLRDTISESLMARAGCHFITVSAASRRILLGRLAARRNAENKVHVVYNGTVNPQKILFEERVNLRKEWGIQDDTPLVGVVGRIEQQKNPEFFARLLAEVHSLQPRFRAVWVGDGLMRSELVQQMRNYGLADKFQVDGWRNDVAKRLQAMDLFVLPSQFEGLPLALQEAMAAGLPVCVADVDGMGEFINDGVNGYLCQLTDGSSWVSRVVELLENNRRRHEIGRQARSFAEAHFSLDAMAKSTLAIYSKAISSFR